MKHVHILGICGTFMGSLAILAKQKGLYVTGSDQNVYSPMDQILKKSGIAIISGYDINQFRPSPDITIIGNAMSRGNLAIEYLLNKNMPIISGPQFLAEYILRQKSVIAVAGTHGKTTVATMLAWIMEQAGMQPGYLIGGIPLNMKTPAKIGKSDFFIIEADEYDTAFFDKRAKFIHYRPKTLLLNNLEFDHADIFSNLQEIQKQFHHLLKTVSSQGLIICPKEDINLQKTLSMGCWTPIEWIGSNTNWQTLPLAKDCTCFELHYQNRAIGKVTWKHTGKHNMQNALSAIVTAKHLGVEPQIACQALEEFKGIKRRMELLAKIGNIRIFDDFAHHPTAIQATLSGWKAHSNAKKIRVVIEPRSNTMKQGIHKHKLNYATEDADEVIWFQPPDLTWSLEKMVSHASTPTKVFNNMQIMIEYIVDSVQEHEDILILSNGGFGGLHKKLINQLKLHSTVLL